MFISRHGISVYASWIKVLSAYSIQSSHNAKKFITAAYFVENVKNKSDREKQL